MKTPSHWILNLVFLGQAVSPAAKTAITLGAILPDVPIFVFYAISKYIHCLPESTIWNQAYYAPFWQNTVALLHSLPLAGLGLAGCAACQWQPGVMFCLSLIAHSLLDLPVHHDDAHRHFFPLSDYRWISPISYWDRAHYGSIVALVELLLVLAATPLVLSLLDGWVTKGTVLAVDLIYIVGYIRFYLLSHSSVS